MAQKLSRRKRGVGSTLALLSFLAALVGLSETASAQPRLPIRFIDVAGKAGVTLRNVSGGPRKDYILEAAGNGAAFFDYDDDGDMDLLLVNGSTFEKFKQGGGPMVALYSNDGKGKFSDVTGQSGLTKKGWGMGVCVADYDNSGFQDIYVTAYGPNILFRNKGDGTFADATEPAGVGDSHWSTTCAFGDYNRDGYVDLYVANYVAFDEETTPGRGTSSLCQYRGMDVFCGPRGLPGEPDVLYRNNGDGTFKDVTHSAKIDDPGYYGFGVIFSDVNNDEWPDIYVANDSTPNFLFRNNTDGTFSEVGLEAGVALSEEGRPQAGMGVDVGDYNNDGYFDIFVTNFSEDTNTLYQNNGDETFNVVTSAAGLGRSSLPYLGWGTGLVDLDNDGYLDIFIANGHIYPKIDQFAFGSTFLERNQLYQNQGNGRFLELTEELEVGLLTRKSSRGAAFGDYDNDGDVDILLTNLDDRPSLLRNEGGNRNHWVTLRLVGRVVGRLVGRKSNRDAIGARITAEIGDRTQTTEVRSGGSYLSHNDSRVHFGLGQETHVKRLEIRWPSGLVENFRDIQGDQFLQVTEGQGMTPIKTIRKKGK